jgi:ribosomal protein L21E
MRLRPLCRAANARSDCYKVWAVSPHFHGDLGSLCNKDGSAVYKHVFDGNTASDLVLSSIGLGPHTQRG